MIDFGNAMLLQRRKTAYEKFLKSLFGSPKAVMNDGAARLSMLADLIPEGSTTIDVGANVGEFARALSRLSGGGMVLAFEPQAMPRAVLTLAGFMRRKSGIMVLPFALGETDGLVELSIPIKKKGQVGVGLAHIGDDGDFVESFEVRKELVALITLDAVMERIEAGPVSFMKIDVEGGELGVLRGAEALIAKHKPAILCEIDDREARFGASESELYDFLTARGYAAYSIADRRPLTLETLEKNTIFIAA